MATHKTEAELRAAIENLEIEYCLGRMLSRQFRRRKERLLKEIRRQKEKSAPVPASADQENGNVFS